MAAISAELDLEIAKLRRRLGEAEARVGRFASEGARKGDRFAKGFEGSVSRGASRAGNAVSRFFSGFRGAARATVGIAAITTTLVVLNRRFPVIGHVASKAFGTLTRGATQAVGVTNKVAASMGNLRRAAALAVGVYSLAKALRALRGSGGGEVKLPRLPSGGGGGIFGQVFGGSLLGNLASKGIAAAMDKAKSAIGAVMGQARNSLSGAADMEQTQISFGVMLGSDSAATAMIDELQRKAASTPFELPSLTGAANKLLQYGVAADSVLSTLDMLGDISGGNAQKLDALANVFGQMSSTGRLTGGDLLQMINAGFNPLQEIAARTGKDIKTLKKEMEMGDVDAETAIQAFRDATSEGGRFFGMMQKQGKSAKGLMASLRDAWGMNQLAFGKPVLESVKPLLEDAIGLVERMRDRAAEWGTKVATGVDYVRAALQEMSGGELLSMAGDGLKLAFMEAVNLLARGMQAVFKAANDAEFMGELETRLEQFADRLKIALLEAVAAAFEAMQDLPGIGKTLGTASYGLRMAAHDVDRDARVREKKKPKRDPVDLGERFLEHFAAAGNIFGAEAEELRNSLAARNARINRRAKKNKAEREAAKEEGAGGGGEEEPPVTKIYSYAGNAVQNAVNALFNRPMEAQQVSLLREIANNTKPKPPTPPRPSVPGAGTGIGVFA